MLRRNRICVSSILLAVILMGVDCIETSIRTPDKRHVDINRDSLRIGNSVNSKDAIHPMLYFTVNDIGSMRKKADTTHAKISKTIKSAAAQLKSNPKKYLPPESYDKFASNWNEVYGNNLCAFSMYCLLYPDDEEVFGLVRVYMDRMQDYQDWYVASSRGKDEVPISHSLTGFATAYDFLYSKLDPERRVKYLNKIESETLNLYEILLKRRAGWTRQYIHNHAASISTSMLIGALVSSARDADRFKPVIEAARNNLDFAMTILKNIVDGSLDEGVSYGSYTARGLLQYVFLSKHHFDIDHMQNPWLKNHFWFYYYTVLPGFQRAVGIADSNFNWFYGPESQLVFLDAYVLKNGYGNWLADKIRNARSTSKPFAQSGSQLWSTVHTEFIFYNAALLPREPVGVDANKLHVFSDWGVVTFGAGKEMKPGNTFLSFKSASLNGEFVCDVLNNEYYKEKVEGWKNFNPGHEHPDQNSFTFVPNGRYVVTETLYGPKFSYLDNVLLFSCSSGTPACNQNWVGQLGESETWLRYQELPSQMGEIISASETNGMVFIAGESAGAYHKSLGLESVFRGILLLNPEVLIVVDSIRLHSESKTEKATAVFHNVMQGFKKSSHLGHEGAQVEYPEGAYSVFWMTHGIDSFSSTFAYNVKPPRLRETSANYVNLTYNLNHKENTVVSLFFGPAYQITAATIMPASGPSGIHLAVTVNKIDYKIHVSTVTSSTSRKLVPVTERRKITGFAGYARVDVGSESHFFGTAGPNSSTDRKKEIMRKFFTENMPGIHVSKRIFNSRPRGMIKEEAIDLNLLLLTPAISFVLFMMYRQKHSFNLRRYLVIYVCLGILTWLSCFFGGDYSTSDCEVVAHPERRPSSVSSDDVSKPLIVIASLPASGSEYLENLFDNSSHFLYIPSAKVNAIPIGGSLKITETDLCSWPDLKNKHNLLTLGWFHSLTNSVSLVHFNNVPETNMHVTRIKKHLRQNQNAIIALDLNSGFWSTKLPWISQVVGEGNLRPILVVRDPRSWIYALTDNMIDSRSQNQQILHSLLRVYANLDHSCQDNGITLTLYGKPDIALKNSQLSVAEKLATVWTISTATALYNNFFPDKKNNLQVVRLEDVHGNPERLARSIFSGLGMPLSVKSLNRFLRNTNSEFFRVPYDHSDLAWKKGLLPAEIRQIESICCPIMKMLDYDC